MVIVCLAALFSLKNDIIAYRLLKFAWNLRIKYRMVHFTDAFHDCRQRDSQNMIMIAHMLPKQNISAREFFIVSGISIKIFISYNFRGITNLLIKSSGDN